MTRVCFLTIKSSLSHNSKLTGFAPKNSSRFSQDPKKPPSGKNSPFAYPQQRHLNIMYHNVAQNPVGYILLIAYQHGPAIVLTFNMIYTRVTRGYHLSAHNYV